MKMETNENRNEKLERILNEARETTDMRPDEPLADTVPPVREKQQEKPPVGKKKKKQKESGILSDLIALLLRIGWIALILSILLLVVCGITVNKSNRMAPAFHDRDVVIFYRMARDIKAGEVVVYRAGNGQLLLGRVVAKGGDTVHIDQSGLKINGYYQTEPYIKGDTVLFEGGVSLPVKLRQGEFFVLCDDSSQGGDSRTIGPISEERIVGRVMVSIRLRDF
jgi:signal peptidase I